MKGVGFSVEQAGRPDSTLVYSMYTAAECSVWLDGTTPLLIPTNAMSAHDHLDAVSDSSLTFSNFTFPSGPMLAVLMRGA